MALFENYIGYMKVILFTFMVNSGFLNTPIEIMTGCPRGVDHKKILFCAAGRVLGARGMTAGFFGAVALKG